MACEICVSSDKHYQSRVNEFAKVPKRSAVSTIRTRDLPIVTRYALPLLVH